MIVYAVFRFLIWYIIAGKCCTSKRFLKNGILLYSQAFEVRLPRFDLHPDMHGQTSLLTLVTCLTCLTCPSCTLDIFGPPGASRWSEAVSSRPAWGLSSRSPTTCTATACVRTPGKVLANACECQKHGHARRDMNTMRRQPWPDEICSYWVYWASMYQTEVGMQVLWGECTQELWACTSSVSSWSQIVPSRLGLQVCNHQFPRPNHRVLSCAPVMCESCWRGCHCHQVGRGMREGWLGGMSVYQHFSEGCTHLGFSGWWELGARIYSSPTILP